MTLTNVSVLDTVQSEKRFLDDVMHRLPGCLCFVQSTRSKLVLVSSFVSLRQICVFQCPSICQVQSDLAEFCLQNVVFQCTLFANVQQFLPSSYIDLWLTLTVHCHDSVLTPNIYET